MVTFDQYGTPENPSVASAYIAGGGSIGAYVFMSLLALAAPHFLTPQVPSCPPHMANQTETCQLK